MGRSLPLCGVVLAAALVFPGTALAAKGNCPGVPTSTTRLADVHAAVSDWLTTGPAGGSITATTTTSWSNDSSLGFDFGPVHDFLSAHIGVTISHSQSSSVGYTLNVGGNKTARMIYTWHVYDTTLKTRNLVTRTGVCAETGGTYTEKARKGFGYSLQFG